jgi:hypothetical protein
LASGVGGVAPGTQFVVEATALLQQYGPGMNGVMTVFDGSTAIGSYTPPAGTSFAFQVFTFNDASHPWSLGTHVLTLTYSGDTFWPTTTSVPLNFVITNTPDFTLSSIAPLTVKRGGSNSTTVQVLSIAGFSGSVTLSCSGAPAEASCSVTSPVTAGGIGVFSVSAAAPTGQVGQSALLFGTGFLAMLPFGLATVSARRSRHGLLAVSVVTLLLVLVSCGGGGSSASLASPTAPTPTAPTPDPGTPTGTYTITITASSTTGLNTITHTFQASITIQ